VPGPPEHAEHTSFVVIDETRQIAVDFAKLTELLEQTSGRSELATAMEDDKFGSPRHKSLDARCAGSLAFTSRRSVASSCGLALG